MVIRRDDDEFDIMEAWRNYAIMGHGGFVEFEHRYYGPAVIVP